MPHYDPQVSFDHTDYVQAHWDQCTIVIASRRTIALCLSSLRIASYYNTRWHDGGNRIDDNDKLADVHRWVNTALGEMNMSCEIETHLATMAQQLTEINQKLDGLTVTTNPNGATQYFDEIEEMLQELARALGGQTVPILTGGE